MSDYIYIKGVIPWLIFVTLAAIASIGYAIYEETMASIEILINHPYDEGFQQYLSKFGKSYGSTDEYELRRQIFNSNMQFIL